MKFLKIILYFLFQNFISGYNGTLYYNLENIDGKIDLFSINDNSIDFEENNESYQGNFISGSTILIKTSNLTSCSFIYGYMEYEDEKQNTSIIWKNSSENIQSNKNINYNGNICPYTCFDVAEGGSINFISYIPFKCEEDVNQTYIVNIDEGINISNLTSYFNSTNNYEIYSASFPDEEIGIINVDKEIMSKELKYNSKQNFFFNGTSKTGITHFSFHGRINELHNYTATITPCTMTLIVCWTGCKTCNYSNIANNTHHYCYDCIEGYAYNKTEDKEGGIGNCINIEQGIVGYFALNSILYKCDDTCLTCELNSTNCIECKNTLYKKNGEGNICKIKEKNEYLKDDILYDCYHLCASCSKGGNDTQHNCDTCYEGYYLFNFTNCINKAPAENYYFDRNKFTYYMCDIRCATCIKGGNEFTSNCIKCHHSSDPTSIDHINYYSVEIDRSQCLSKEEINKIKIYKNYYFNDTERALKKCHESCATCHNEGYDNDTKCDSCIENYTFIQISENVKNCIEEKSVTQTYSNYYKTIDENNNIVYYECYELCATCKKGGNSTLNNCETCIEGYKKFGLLNCVKEKIENNIENENDDINNNIVIIDGKEINCYNTCNGCFNEGKEENQNCLDCKNGLEYTTGNELGNCLDLNKITPNLSELKQFLPLIGNDEFKSLSINDSSYNFNYYSLSINDLNILNKNKVSHLTINNECQNKLHEKYISSNKFYVAQINKNNTNINFLVFDQDGNEIDLLTNCLNEKINFYFPISISNSSENLINSILSSNINEIEFNSYDIYNENSNFYNDECFDLKINKKRYFLEQRIEMYNKQIYFCPDFCELINYSKNSNMINCECTINNKSDNIKIFEINRNLKFNKNHIIYNGFMLFQCKILLKNFPDKKSFLHYFIIIGILIYIICIFLFYFSSISQIRKIISSSLTNPPKINKKIKKEKKVAFKEDTIKIKFKKKHKKKKIKNNSKNSSIREMITIQEKNFFDSKMKEKMESNNYSNYIKLNFLSFKSVKKKDKRTSYEYFIGIIKEKIFLISIFTNNNFWFPKVFHLIVNYLIFILVLTLNSFFWKKKDIFLNYKSYLISAFFGFLFLSILHYFLSFYSYNIKYDNNEKINDALKTLKIRNLFIFLFCFIISALLWFYLYLFGVINNEYQKDILMLTIISIFIIIIFQFIIAFLSTLFRTIGIKSKKKKCYFLSQLLYFMF